MAAKEKRAESKWKKIQRKILKKIPLDEKSKTSLPGNTNLIEQISVSDKPGEFQIPTLMVEEQLIDLEDENFSIIGKSKELIKSIEEDEKSIENYIKGKYLIIYF